MSNDTVDDKWMIYETLVATEIRYTVECMYVDQIWKISTTLVTKIRYTVNRTYVDQIWKISSTLTSVGLSKACPN